MGAAQWEHHDEVAPLEHQRGLASAWDTAGGVSQLYLPWRSWSARAAAAGMACWVGTVLVTAFGAGPRSGLGSGAGLGFGAGAELGAALACLGVRARRPFFWIVTLYIRASYGRMPQKFSPVSPVCDSGVL